MALIMCKRCWEEKPLEDFPNDPNKSNGKYSYCLECKRAYMRETRTPERDFLSNLRRACKRVGISVEDYYRIRREQGEVCAICGKPGTASKTTTRMALDHDHITGKFRALLCGPCNTGLGSFRDSPERLRKAAEYLERFQDGS